MDDAIEFQSEPLAIRYALEGLRDFVNQPDWVAKIPFEKRAGFNHPKHGKIVIAFELSHLSEPHKFKINMLAYVQRAKCSRWISTGDTNAIRQDASRFAADPSSITGMLPEIYYGALY